MKLGAKHWTPEQINKLKDLYPYTETKDLEEVFGKSYQAIRMKAERLGIKKYQEILPDGYRRCPRCKEVKKIEEFRDYSSYCHECRLQKCSEWGKSHKSHLLAYFHNVRKRKEQDKLTEHNAIASHKQRALIKTGHTLTQKEWREIIKEFDNTCPMCKKPFTAEDPAVRDCIVPVSKGGLLCKENVQPLHAKCNFRKGTKIIDYRNICQGVTA